MKKLVLTAIAVFGIAASSLAQGTIAMDNLGGTGNNHATSFGLFFAADGTPYGGATINMQLYGGASAGSLALLATGTGAGALVGLGGGTFADPNGAELPIAGVAGGANATVQVLAWIGNAASYAAASPLERFWAWNGSAFVDAATFTFLNGTGGPTIPPSPPRSLDGMPAMQLIVPEPTTFALLGLGALGMMIFRRK